MTSLPDYEMGFINGDRGCPPVPQFSPEFRRGHDHGVAHRKYRQDKEAENISAAAARKAAGDIFSNGVRLSDGLIYTAEWDRDGCDRQFLAGYHTFDIYRQDRQNERDYCGTMHVVARDDLGLIAFYPVERFCHAEDYVAPEPEPKPKRPSGSNADDWVLFLDENLRIENGRISGIGYLAVQIAEALDCLKTIGGA
jgi:hypothetical protein